MIWINNRGKKSGQKYKSCNVVRSGNSAVGFSLKHYQSVYIDSANNRQRVWERFFVFHVKSRIATEVAVNPPCTAGFQLVNIEGTYTVPGAAAPL